jgi:hypothetical protein
MANCHVKLDTVPKDRYIAYVPVENETVSDIIATKLTPLISSEQTEDTSLLEEILAYTWEHLADESTSGIAASHLGTVLYCKYQGMSDGDEKVETATLIEGYFRDGIQSVDNPLAQTCLQYAMFRLQENKIDDDALVAAQTG